MSLPFVVHDSIDTVKHSGKPVVQEFEYNNTQTVGKRPLAPRFHQKPLNKVGKVVHNKLNKKKRYETNRRI